MTPFHLRTRTQKTSVYNTASPEAKSRVKVPGVSLNLMVYVNSKTSSCSRPDQRSGAKKSNTQHEVSRSEVCGSKVKAGLEQGWRVQSKVRGRTGARHM